MSTTPHDGREGLKCGPWPCQREFEVARTVGNRVDDVEVEFREGPRRKT